MTRKILLHIGAPKCGSTYIAKRLPYEGRSFEQFTLDRFRSINYFLALKKWSEHFPKNPMIIARHKDIRLTIQKNIGCEINLNWELKHSLSNPSLRMEDCDRIAAAMTDASVSKDQIREMFQDSFSSVKKTDMGKTIERRAWIEAIYEPLTTAILKKFGFDNRLKI